MIIEFVYFPIKTSVIFNGKLESISNNAAESNKSSSSKDLRSSVNSVEISAAIGNFSTASAAFTALLLRSFSAIGGLAAARLAEWLHRSTSKPLHAGGASRSGPENIQLQAFDRA
jgi:hypothetical protein